MNTRDLHSQLAQLPETDSRDFEPALIACHSELLDSGFGAVEEDLLLLAYDAADLDDSDVGFKAFYLLALHHRRNYDLSRYGSLVERFRLQYGHRPLFAHLEAMYLVRSGRVRRGVRMARAAAEQLPDHSGCLHHFAEATTTAIEQGEHIEGATVDAAIKAAEKAASFRPGYGKFYATLGRLASARGEYEEARLSLQYAIDLEPSDGRDYDRRLAEYYRHLARVDRTEAESALAAELETARRTIESVEMKATAAIERSQARVVESIAFFAGVIALILGSVTLMAGRGDAVEVGLLIVVLTGGLVAAFSGFLAIYRNTAGWIHVSVAVLGATAVAAGMAALVLT